MKDKIKNKEKGAVIVEAAIVLALILLFILPVTFLFITYQFLDPVVHISARKAAAVARTLPYLDFDFSESCIDKKMKRLNKFVDCSKFKTPEMQSYCNLKRQQRVSEIQEICFFQAQYDCKMFVQSIKRVDLEARRHLMLNNFIKDIANGLPVYFGYRSTDTGLS